MVSRALRATPLSRPASVRLIVLLVVVALTTGIAATVVTAASLPSCRVADTLDQAAFVRGLEPNGPRHHLSCGQRLLPRRPALDGECGPEQRPSRPGIRRSPTSRRWPGPRGRPGRVSPSNRHSAAIRPRNRPSPTGRASRATARRSGRAPGPGTASISSGPRSTSGATADRRPGITPIGAPQRPEPGSRRTPGNMAS